MRKRSFLLSIVALTVLVLHLAVGELPERVSFGEWLPFLSEGDLSVNDVGLTEEGIGLDHPRHQALFGADGVHFTPRSGDPYWYWQLTHVGSEDTAQRGVVSGPVSPKQTDDYVISYLRGAVIERYLARANDVEQQFVIPEPLPLEGQDLVIAGVVGSTGRFKPAEAGWRWVGRKGFVHLSDVYVYDAEGNEVEARMEVTESSTRITVDGAALAKAVYPVTIDPVIGANDQRLSDMAGLGSGTGVADDAEIAYGGTQGEFFTVWEGTEADASTEEVRIFGQFIDAATGGEVGTSDILVGDPPGGPDPDLDAFDPAVAYNPGDNEFLVVFGGEEDPAPFFPPGETEVFGQRFDASTRSTTGGVFQISDCGTDGDGDADVGGIGGGTTIDVAHSATSNRYLVVWRCDDAGDQDADGDGVNDSASTGTPTNFDFEILGQVVSGAGSLVLNNDFVISFTDGTLGTNVFDFHAEFPAVAWNSDHNQFLVTWVEDNATLGDGNREVFGQLVDASGDLLATGGAAPATCGVATGCKFQISSVQHANNIDNATSDVVYNPATDEYLVIWGGDTVTDNTSQVYGQRVSAAGSLSGGRIDISANGTASNGAEEPSVAYNSLENEFMVVWNASSATAGELEIFYQRVSSTGSLVGPTDPRVSDLGPNTDTTFDADFRTGLAYADSSLNTYHSVWAGQDNRGGQVAGENEIFGHAIEPVLEIAKTMTSGTGGIDGGDVIQYTIVVEHKEVDEGPDLGIDVSLRDAFNLDITDDVPDMLENVTIVSALLDDGSGATSDISGLLNIDANGDLETTGDIDLDHDFTTPGGDHESITIIISGTVPDSKGPDDVVLSSNTAMVEWENLDSGLDHPQYDATSTDNTSLTFADPFAVGKTADVANATIGDTITYTATVTVVEGTTTNVKLEDTLPAGTTYVAASAMVASANGMTISPLIVTGPAGQLLTIDIASVLNPGDGTDPAVVETDDFTITYQVTVDYDPGVNTSGVQLQNSLDASADGVAADNNNLANMVQIEAGTVTINKSTTPASGTGFTFTEDVAAVAAANSLVADLSAFTGTFPLDDGDSLVFQDIPVAFTYMIGEDDPTGVGFALTAINCDSGSTSSVINGGGAGGTLTVNLADGDNIGCTFENDKQADLSVTKSGPAMVNHGEEITYTMTVENLNIAGFGSATNVMLFDTLPAGTNFVSVDQGECMHVGGVVTCSGGALASLALGGTFTAMVVVDTDGVAATKTGFDIMNQAEASADEADPVPTNNDATNLLAKVTTSVKGADIAITKAADNPTPIAGTQLVYTVTVNNLGDGTAFNVSVSDTLPGGVSNPATAGGCSEDPNGVPTCSLGDIAGGGMAQYTITVDIDTDTMGVIDNMATVSADFQATDETGVESVTESVTVSKEADLSIMKEDDVATQVLVGNNFNYTITVTNNGPSIATSVVVSDTLPAEVSLVSLSTDTGACPGGVFPCNLGDLMPSDVAIITATVTATTEGTASNTATVSSGVTDPISGNDSSTEETTIVNEADLSVTKSQTSPVGDVPAGTNVTYVITVTNGGPSDATAATISDTLPAGLTIVSITPDAALDCSGSDAPGGTNIVCTLASTLVNGAMGSVTVVAAVPASQAAGQVTNNATVGSVVPSDPDNTNDTGTVMTDVVRESNLGITKLQTTPTAGTDIVAGNNVTYTLEVTNSGPSDAANVSVNDALPAGLTVVGTSGCNPDGALSTCNLDTIAAGAMKQFTLTAQVGAGQPSGMITNNASVSSDSSDPTPGNNSTSETITVIGLFSLEVFLPGMGSGSGTVVGDVAGEGGGINCPSVSCVDNYQDLMPPIMVVLTPTPNAGSLFGGWDPDCEFVQGDGTCKVTMDEDETATANFLTPSEGITMLINQINGAGLQGGFRNSLRKKAQNASKSLSKGNDADAIDQLTSLINEINAQIGKKIDAGTAAVLIAKAQAIIVAIMG